MDGKTKEELLKEKKKLQEYLEWGKDFLVFEDLHNGKKRLQQIDTKLNSYE